MNITATLEQLNDFGDYLEDNWGIIIPVIETRPIAYRVFYRVVQLMPSYPDTVYGMANAVLCYLTFVNMLFCLWNRHLLRHNKESPTTKTIRMVFWYTELALYTLFYGSELYLTQVIYKEPGTVIHHLIAFLIFYELLDIKKVTLLTLFPLFVHEWYFLTYSLEWVVLYNLAMLVLGYFGSVKEYGKRLVWYCIVIQYVNYYFECATKGNERMSVCVVIDGYPHLGATISLGLFSGITTYLYYSLTRESKIKTE
ncbi:hypothetical protein HDV01_003393 [Terramyces sp. JEL0728]|nr:hypothetical protein HDV01_003393 [Terramyces sp. JEL0728]